MWPNSHAIYLFRAARAIRTIATHIFYDIFGPPEPSDIQPAIGIPAYLQCLRSPEWVSRRATGGHPFHYSVGITAYLQCLRSPTFGQHGEKCHPSRTERPMGTATPHSSHAKWLFLMILLVLIRF